jgi:hypothetical protein
MTIGIAGALALTRVMISLLYGVGAPDALTLILVPLRLMGASLLAC